MTLPRRLLIANRGEIACRIATTARRLGVRTIAVYSDIDAGAWHVELCDEAVPLGGTTARDSYLDIARVMAAARASGADALHPGYGFLSENPDLARAVEQAGLIFVGPPADAMAAMGSKSAAKTLMARAGVPVVPGYHGDEQASGFLAAQASHIGYPVLIKAIAGGGGKGMRVVHDPDTFADALASCRREAAASFGDDRVLIERYLHQPRHIEIQVFADRHGHAVHLFERDCSVQRRHQKVLEEAPAPGLDDDTRQRMGEAAVAAARSVGYVGAGTVEFICEPDGRFYFMEMNTRLQVEHPVTEALTGLDLVEWQLRVAGGEPLPLAQDAIPRQGHAIEARICAETSDGRFLPATGRIAHLLTPAASRFEPGPVRLDCGVRAGDTVTPHYDAMIAKLIVHGVDRQAALQQLDAALAQLHIVGLPTNIDFLRRLVRCNAFAQARLDTHLIEREHAALFDTPGLSPERAALASVLAWWADHTSARTALPHDPWSSPSGWCLHGHARQLHRVRVGEQTLDLSIEAHDGGRGLIVGTGPGRPTVRLEALGGGFRAAHGPHGVQARLPDGLLRATVVRDGTRHDVFTDDGHAVVEWLDPLHVGDTTDAGGDHLRTAMPGRVIGVRVQVGQTVHRGDPLVVTEAMKMEHTLVAPRDGVVAELLCQVGDQVPEGAELLRLDEASSSPPS